MITLIFAYLHGGLILFQSTVPTMTLQTMSWSCWRRRLYLAVPTHSDFGQKTTIRLSETRDADYICLAGSRPIRQITNSYFEEEGFSPHIVFESDTTESVRNLIAAGMGIGFWPQHSWGTIPEKHGDSPEQFPVRLLHIEDRRLPPPDHADPLMKRGGTIPLSRISVIFLCARNNLGTAAFYSPL